MQPLEAVLLILNLFADPSGAQKRPRDRRYHGRCQGTAPLHGNAGRKGTSPRNDDLGHIRRLSKAGTAGGVHAADLVPPVDTIGIILGRPIPYFIFLIIFTFVTEQCSLHEVRPLYKGVPINVTSDYGDVMIKKLLPLLAIGLIALVCVASGAFTSVSAVRAAEVTVAGDQNALLTISPSTGPNGAYFVDTDNDGAYELDISSQGAGLNVDASIVLRDVFTITNNGTQTVTVQITGNGAHTDKVSFGEIESGLSLAVGQSVSVTVTIDTMGLEEGDYLLDTITIEAHTGA